MKKLFTLSLLALTASMALAAEDVAPAPTQLTHCSKPIASVMVGKLACKASSCAGNASNSNNLLAQLMAAAGQVGSAGVTGVGDGIRDMFVTVLQSSGCVDLQDREAMAEIAEELKLAGKEIKVQQADFIVSGALTSIELENSRSGFGGGFIPVIGSISKNTQKATVGLDMKLVDVNSAKVVESRRFSANSEKSSWGLGVLGGGSFGGGAIGFGGSMSSLKGTSLEMVAREAVIQAANGVIEGLSKAKGLAVVTPVVAPVAVAPVAVEPVAAVTASQQ